jgi:hypothetical protein
MGELNMQSIVVGGGIKCALMIFVCQPRVRHEGAVREGSAADIAARGPRRKIRIRDIERQNFVERGVGMKIGLDADTLAREIKVRAQNADRPRRDLREIDTSGGIGESVHESEPFAEDADVRAAHERMRIGRADVGAAHGDAHSARSGERPQTDDEILPQQFALRVNLVRGIADVAVDVDDAERERTDGRSPIVNAPSAPVMPLFISAISGLL